jgi:NADPH-dependent 2,4-dienoyl-CoA reductase/sulfur reductase-like enzyme
VTNIVIIGGVAGGASAAARLRRLDEQAQIIMLERGPYISFANCGLPYHIGGVIEPREELLLFTPEDMQARFNIDVRVFSEAVSINRSRQTITVRRTDTGETYQLPYDKVVIATGSSPLRPPIPGIDSPRIRQMWTVPDADAVKKLLQDGSITRTAVIGGGFIGLEMAENLRHLGLQVSLIEAMDQVMAPLDREMALLLEKELKAKGVELTLNDAVDSFQDTGDRVTIRLKSGRQLSAQLVILAIGVRPNGQIAKEAGLDTNPRGGIVVNSRMQTSDPNIYAVGDVVQVKDLVSGDDTMIPLAGPANKQGRIAADNIAGLDSQYRGSLGTSVARVFELTAATTGANEKALQRRGLTLHKDYHRVYVSQNDHAGYYPGATRMMLKLLFSADGQQIYGAQIVGQQGVDKRIDTLATAIRLGASVQALEELELAYAPPYSSAKDPVNMAGFMAGNLLAGHTAFAPWDALEKEPNLQVLDVQETYEAEEFAIPGAINIPLGELRQRYQELDRNKPTVVFCAVGVRAHTAEGMLRSLGFTDVRLYPGGAWFYDYTHS